MGLDSCVFLSPAWLSFRTSATIEIYILLWDMTECNWLTARTRL